MSAEFEQLVAPYRGELLAHCYRMTGALSDAEDALQNALMRAWRAFEQFEGRSALRTWLYKISTNACLDLLASRRARSLPELADSTPADEPGEPAWLEPLPTPASAYANREAVRLAFIVALQVLQPRQRATLILREVVGMSAEETAAALDTSVAAVNSTLQRARARLDEQPRVHAPRVTAALDELLGKYLRVWETGDADGLVALLRSDAILSMPPMPQFARGPDAIRELVRTLVFPRGPMRLMPTWANGSPAFGVYMQGQFVGLAVIDIEDDLVASHHLFMAVDPTKFGLARELA